LGLSGDFYSTLPRRDGTALGIQYYRAENVAGIDRGPPRVSK